MASSKVTTVIVNRSGQALILRVGNQNCFAKLATIAAGGEHKVEIDVNWTYQEFSLEPVKAGLLKKIVVNSDDCCDFKRLTVTESEGKLQVDKVPRGQFSTHAPPLFHTWRTFFTLPKWIKWRFWL
ncbi:hypothetical protein KC19_2G159200 [Ceratodon purpureus]|uniref:DUF7748 domain-containing protein n=1 Tax=Ceratodon purpureus TaxID=3225 RepID=A0A8T0IUF5_CERPU|nr:hypothetical protein KC19_2G159200 [Ceratodon purpureus]